mmetsp:Transcript_17652/g.28446  ORF Transcript_17652/g.28446 Transcript_17652/m.28446 type:complete len:100 (+) Transcript_17652:724-1023(+)
MGSENGIALHALESALHLTVSHLDVQLDNSLVVLEFLLEQWQHRQRVTRRISDLWKYVRARADCIDPLTPSRSQEDLVSRKLVELERNPNLDLSKPSAL